MEYSDIESTHLDIFTFITIASAPFGLLVPQTRIMRREVLRRGQDVSLEKGGSTKPAKKVALDEPDAAGG